MKNARILKHTPFAAGIMILLSMLSMELNSLAANGYATRYWDCCKPHCGWSGNISSGKPMKTCNVLCAR